MDNKFNELRIDRDRIRLAIKFAKSDSERQKLGIELLAVREKLGNEATNYHNTRTDIHKIQNLLTEAMNNPNRSSETRYFAKSILRLIKTQDNTVPDERNDVNTNNHARL